VDNRDKINEKGYMDDRQVYMPCRCRSLMISGHSDLKMSAPVREPSPPQTTNASIPSLIRL
jgi:hypothetical protein